MTVNAFLLREVLCELPVSAFRSCLSKDISPVLWQNFPWRIEIGELESPSMTRSSIELTIKIFVVLLVATFVWTLCRVYGMLA